MLQTEGGRWEGYLHAVRRRVRDRTMRRKRPVGMSQIGWPCSETLQALFSGDVVVLSRDGEATSPDCSLSGMSDSSVVRSVHPDREEGTEWESVGLWAHMTRLLVLRGDTAIRE